MLRKALFGAALLALAFAVLFGEAAYQGLRRAATLLLFGGGVGLAIYIGHRLIG